VLESSRAANGQLPIGVARARQSLRRKAHHAQGGLSPPRTLVVGLEMYPLLVVVAAAGALGSMMRPSPAAMIRAGTPALVQ